MAYVTVAEFQAETSMTDQYEEEEIEAALRFGEQLFDRLTKRDKWGMWCAPRHKTFKLDGRGHPHLQLPWPIVTLTSVTVDDEEVDCAVYYRFITMADGTDFPEGIQNVIVEADWGDKRIMEEVVEGEGEEQEVVYQVPYAVKQCVIRMAEMKLTREKVFADERVLRIGPLNDIKIGSITGSVDLDGIIEAYRVLPQVTPEVR